MINIVGIRFQQDGKMLYYDAGSFSLQNGDYVVAETSRGLDLGEVILTGNEMADDQVNSALPKVIRIATEQDIQQATDNRAREREAYAVCQKKIAEHKLEMKLVSVETTFDNGKMLFYFTANGRVDFRALVKDLASTFRTRIELRQIGVRDEARMLGGLGPCGRPICCGAFLNDFQPVSIKMAKEQNLSLNPTKISGVCGRLMCCLKYEQDQYEEIRRKMPRIGRDVETPDGRGTVCDLNVVKETVSVRIPNGDSTEIKQYPLSQITRITPDGAGAAGKTEPPRQDMDPAGTSEITEEERKMIQDLEANDFAAENSGAEVTRESNPRDRKSRANAKNAAGLTKKPQQAGAPEDGVRRKENRPKGKNNHNSGKDKPERENNQLGRPVRRENRTAAPGNAGNSPAHNSRGEQKANDSARTPAKKGSGMPSAKKEDTGADRGENAISKDSSRSGSRGWADALEKAMKAAEK